MSRAKLPHGSPDDIEASYYDALARADLESLMALWAEDEEIVCVHPGTTRLVGHVAIRNAWEEILAHGGLHIQPRQLRAAHTMTTAIHHVIEDVLRPDNARPDVHVIATNVYMKTVQGWRIVAHHASVAPGPAPAESIPEIMLH